MTHRHMNVETVTEAAQFPEKEYINGIFLAAVWKYGGNELCPHYAVLTEKAGHFSQY